MSERQPQSGMEHWARSMEDKMATQREQLRAHIPEQIAANSGATWIPNDSVLSLTFLQQPLRIQVPDYTFEMQGDADVVSMMTQSLVTTYLLTASGASRVGEWIAFRELPSGMFYHQAFSGYTGGRLVSTLGDDLDAFKRGAESVDGKALPDYGNAAYEFQVLPRLWLAVVYWLGDEEDGFPSQATVLFDRSASNYMILDGLAIIGSQLIQKIIKSALS